VGIPRGVSQEIYGGVRFCIAYRALNKIAKKDIYPLAHTPGGVERRRRFPTLDLRSGYRQIGMAPGDRDNTAFTTKRGLYRFKLMPFGLMNAPSTFQRMVNRVLRGLIWLTCLVFWTAL
jgi:hypothetical protein